MNTKYIVVLGGVISGVGKGVTTASLGKIMKEYGYKVTLIKIDPYINCDAGTLRPTEHGEVWVTEDGGEIDQDLGTYERFLDQDILKKNNITTGQIYRAVIDRERRGEYLGKTVQFIPHIVEEIMHRIRVASDGYEIAIIEIGGTIGDYENVPFLYAVKALERYASKHDMAYVLVTYLPIPRHMHEMKTKPAQQSIKLCHEAGIFPDIIICRAHAPLDTLRREKIEVLAQVQPDAVISSPDVETIYQIPIDLEQEKIGDKMLARLGLSPRAVPCWDEWKDRVHVLTHAQQKLMIAVVGKYCTSGEYSSADSYVSIEHALVHAAAESGYKIEIKWIDSVMFEKEPSSLKLLDMYDAILVPGGFGTVGVEGKIEAISYARLHEVPYLGICYGMQLACVEYARHVAGIPGAHTAEVAPDASDLVIKILDDQKQLVETHLYGGTMKLGAYEVVLSPHTQVWHLYNEAKKLSLEGTVQERHRHRYEVNPAYIDRLRDKGMVFSGFQQRADGTALAEYIELPSHPFFIGMQAHPEFKSRFLNPSPIFKGFIQAALEYQKNRHADSDE
ncbi:MAG: CTP synthase [Candidatus Babeliales bacterium]